MMASSWNVHLFSEDPTSDENLWNPVSVGPGGPSYNISLLPGYIGVADATANFETAVPNSCYNNSIVYWTNSTMPSVTITHIVLERDTMMGVGMWISLALETPETVVDSATWLKYHTQISISLKNP
jgi:hypothetical protein